jgi:uncharacterized protein involved in type VI secretion and phage assembly
MTKLMQFTTTADGNKELILAKLDGVQQLSQPYSFVLEFISEKFDFDPATFVSQEGKIELCALQIINNQKTYVTLKILGVITNFDFAGVSGVHAQYRAIVAPRLQYLANTRQSRVFLNKSIRDIVIEVLKSTGYTDDTIDFPSSIAATARDYVVQYEESDLAFISRWLEHEGVFFYFDHSGTSEKIKFGWGTSNYATITNVSSLKFSPARVNTPAPAVTPMLASRMNVLGAVNNAEVDVEPTTSSEAWFNQEVVQTLTLEQVALPQTVILNDYFYDTPDVSLKVTKTVSDAGKGTVYEYNNNYTTQNDGSRLGDIRVEEIKCRAKLFNGTSNCRAFAPGFTVSMTDHRRSDLNRNYLLTRIVHAATQSQDSGSDGFPSGTYRNAFTAIPNDTVYRPPRATPWPKIPGVIKAKISDSTDGENSGLDDKGRYKVKLGLDLSDTTNGATSNAVRMATPYAGAYDGERMGMHFPLHKDTEVMLSHYNGNPDRPIIAGAVPNPNSRSVVIDYNNVEHLIRTRGDNRIIMSDGFVAAAIEMRAANSRARSALMSLGLHGVIPGVGDEIASININSQAGDIVLDGGYLLWSAGGGLMTGTQAVMSHSTIVGFPKLSLALMLIKLAALHSKETLDGALSQPLSGIGETIAIAIKDLSVVIGTVAANYALVSRKMSKTPLTRFFPKEIIKDITDVARLAADTGWKATLKAGILKVLGFLAYPFVALAGAIKPFIMDQPEGYAIMIVKTLGSEIINIDRPGYNILIATDVGNVDVYAEKDIKVEAKGDLYLDAGEAIYAKSDSGAQFELDERNFHVVSPSSGTQFLMEDAQAVLMSQDKLKTKKSVMRTAPEGILAAGPEVYLSSGTHKGTLHMLDNGAIRVDGDGGVTVRTKMCAVIINDSGIFINGGPGKAITIAGGGTVDLQSQTTVNIKAATINMQGAAVNIKGAAVAIDGSNITIGGTSQSIMNVPPPPLAPAPPPMIMPKVPPIVPLPPFPAAAPLPQASLAMKTMMRTVFGTIMTQMKVSANIVVRGGKFWS